MSQRIHEDADWPRFYWSRNKLAEQLATIRHQQGRLLGRMEALGLGFRQEAVFHTLIEDVVKTSEIEGEKLDRGQVRSSIARRLGLEIGGLKGIDRNVEGVVDMMLDATGRFLEPLTAERLWGWHAALFPTGRSGMKRIRTGAWRDDSNGPMQVVSGPVGRERVHYQAPDASRLDAEMAAFLQWMNGANETDWVVKAGLAHFWFVTIHPFEDGNGRIARAIADLALARSENSSQRFYSVSAQIRLERDAYYEILEQTQKGTMDVTPWMTWFFDCMGRAIAGSQTILEGVLSKARFWETVAGLSLNERQKLVLQRLLDNFEGKLTTSKWSKMAKCSHDTALRDIQALVDRSVLVRRIEGGRSTSYELVKIA